MEETLVILKRLANIKERTFSEDELGIPSDVRKDLVKKKFLMSDKSEPNNPKYHLTDKAYGFIQTVKLGEEGNTIAKKNLWLQIIAIVVAIIAVIVAVLLAYFK